MSLARKLWLAALGLALLPLALMAGGLWFGVSGLAGDASQAQLHARLATLREAQAERVREDIEGRILALRLISQSPGTAQALRDLREGFEAAPREDSGPAARTRQLGLLEHVAQEFNSDWQRLHPGRRPHLGSLAQDLSPQAQHLQFAYVADNPHPIGEKQRLQAAEGGGAYHRAHAQHHPAFERARQQLGVQDLLIIDSASDRVVYSVAKALDFGTHVGDGLTADSALAQAYAPVRQARTPDAAALSSFQDYLPAYGQTAAFVAVPIFEGSQQVGVLALRYPVQRLTTLLQASGATARQALGASGESLLLAADGRLLSEPRELQELPRRAAFYERLTERLPAAALGLMRERQSAVGLLRVPMDTWPSGPQGRGELWPHVDYRGVPALGTALPVSVAGQQWTLLTKIDAAEAEAAQLALNQEAGQRVALLASLLLLATGAAVALCVRRFLEPLRRCTATLSAMAQGRSQARTGLTQGDEIGKLGRALDRLLDERQTLLSRAEHDQAQLQQSVVSLVRTVFQLSHRDMTARAGGDEDALAPLRDSINQLGDRTGSALIELRRQVAQVQAASEAAASQTEAEIGSRHAERLRTEALRQRLHSLLPLLIRSVSGLQSAPPAARSIAGPAASASDPFRAALPLQPLLQACDLRVKRLGERAQGLQALEDMTRDLAEGARMIGTHLQLQSLHAAPDGAPSGQTTPPWRAWVNAACHTEQETGRQMRQLVNEAQRAQHELNRLAEALQLQPLPPGARGWPQAGASHSAVPDTPTQALLGPLADEQRLLLDELRTVLADLDAASPAALNRLDEQARNAQALRESALRLRASVDDFKLPEPA
ncbi:MAG: HAMP domain-containing protein [Rubrivivax sp.]|nr:HAMP domain-containing protein [Rubrivivax sp.]